MAFYKEWRQQRLLYRHESMSAGECSAPSQFSVDPRIVAHEALRAVLDKVPVRRDATVFKWLRTCVVHVMVNHNYSGPAIHVYVRDPVQRRACA